MITKQCEIRKQRHTEILTHFVNELSRIPENGRLSQCTVPNATSIAASHSPAGLNYCFVIHIRNQLQTEKGFCLHLHVANLRRQANVIVTGSGTKITKLEPWIFSRLEPQNNSVTSLERKTSWRSHNLIYEYITSLCTQLCLEE